MGNCLGITENQEPTFSENFSSMDSIQENCQYSRTTHVTGISRANRYLQEQVMSAQIASNFSTGNKENISFHPEEYIDCSVKLHFDPNSDLREQHASEPRVSGKFNTEEQMQGVKHMNHEMMTSSQLQSAGDRSQFDMLISTLQITHDPSLLTTDPCAGTPKEKGGKTRDSTSLNFRAPAIPASYSPAETCLSSGEALRSSIWTPPKPVGLTQDKPQTSNMWGSGESVILNENGVYIPEEENFEVLQTAEEEHAAMLKRRVDEAKLNGMNNLCVAPVEIFTLSPAAETDELVHPMGSTDSDMSIQRTPTHNAAIHDEHLKFRLEDDGGVHEMGSMALEHTSTPQLETLTSPSPNRTVTHLDSARGSHVHPTENSRSQPLKAVLEMLKVEWWQDDDNVFLKVLPNDGLQVCLLNCQQVRIMRPAQFDEVLNLYAPITTITHQTGHDRENKDLLVVVLQKQTSHRQWLQLVETCTRKEYVSMNWITRVQDEISEDESDGDW